MTHNSSCRILLSVALSVAIHSACFAEEYSENDADQVTVSVDKDSLIKELIKRIETLEAIIKDNQVGSVIEVSEKGGDNQSIVDAETAHKIALEQSENLSLIETAFERTLVEEGGLLLQSGTFNYVPTLSYTHSSSDRIVIDGFAIEEILVVGDIVSRQVRRDLVVLTNTFRLGLKNDFQVDLQIPVGREELQSFSSSGDETEELTSGLGDISLSLSYQALKSHPDWPDTLINLSWKSTTGEDPYSLTGDNELSLGTGFQSWGLSFTSVSVSDPVVFFSGLSWTKNISEQKELGRVDTGDSLGMHLGMVFALNLNTSLSYGFQMNKSNKIKIDDQNIPGSDLLTSLFTIGVSRILSNNMSMDVQLGVGLSEDSPDVQVSLSFPFSSL